MISFKQFLLESKIVKKLELEHPNTPVEKFNDALKKSGYRTSSAMLNYLIQQHKKGHLSEYDATLVPTLTNFRTKAHLHGYKDITQGHFGYWKQRMSIYNDVKPTEKERAEDGRVLVHDKDGIKSYWIKNREAIQHFYGGGAKNCPYPTKWCTANDKDMFGYKGLHYVIHDENTGKFFAHLPEADTVTNWDDNKEYREFDMGKLHPEYKDAMEANLEHTEKTPEYKAQKHQYLNNKEVNHLVRNLDNKTYEQARKRKLAILAHPQVQNLLDKIGKKPDDYRSVFDNQ